MINLDQVKPSEAAKKRAEAAGVDLESLKLNASGHYMMLCAEIFLEVSKELLEFASSVFYAALPEHQLFQESESRQVILRAFPVLTNGESEKVMSALGRLVEHPKFAYPLAYVRTVKDTSGEKHQFAVPIPPDTYKRELNHLVGPFENEDKARAWANALKDNVSHDVLRHTGYWFCDVFKMN